MDPDTFNSIYPVSSVTIFSQGSLVVKRECKLQSRPGQRRGTVKGLSRRSLFRMVFLVTESSTKFASILTLTYSNSIAPKSGKVTKSHLASLLQEMRRRWPRIAYCWWLEFQRNGSPHYHILLNIEPTDDDRHWLALNWSIIVSRETIAERKKIYRVHAHKKAWERIRKQDGAMRYMLKYASKAEQKDVPKGFEDVGRFWGANKAVKDGVTALKSFDCDEELLRKLVEIYKPTATDWPILPSILIPSFKEINDEV